MVFYNKFLFVFTHSPRTLESYRYKCDLFVINYYLQFLENFEIINLLIYALLSLYVFSNELPTHSRNISCLSSPYTFP